MRTFAIGDIHGGLKALIQVLNQIEITEEDTLIFMFNGSLVSGLETSIFNYNGVKKTDIDAIQKEILEIIDLSVQVTKYLD